MRPSWLSWVVIAWGTDLPRYTPSSPHANVDPMEEKPKMQPLPPSCQYQRRSSETLHTTSLICRSNIITRRSFTHYLLSILDYVLSNQASRSLSQLLELKNQVFPRLLACKESEPNLDCQKNLIKQPENKEEQQRREAMTCQARKIDLCHEDVVDSRGIREKIAEVVEGSRGGFSPT